MALELTPTWDRDRTVALTLDHERRTLTVRTGESTSRYALVDETPERLGWVADQHESHDGGQRVTVGEVLVACLREYDAEQAVLELTRRAAREAAGRGDGWSRAARGLRREACDAVRRERVSTLPLQTRFMQLSDRRGDDPVLTSSMAAERIGYVAAGRADTSRLHRRLGLDGGQRTVSYRTAVALCDALAVDPTEVGL